MYKNYSFGAKRSKTDIRDHKLNPAGSSQYKVTLPDSCILTHPAIKNQGSINSCVAHVAAEICEYYNTKQENDDSMLSVGYIYGTRYIYTGKGMYLRDALKTLQNSGCASHKEFPYNKEVPKQIELVKKHGVFQTANQNRISSYFRINTSKINDIKYALVNYGPVMASIKWHSAYEVDPNDNHLKPMINFDANDDCGYHCILIYGYNEEGFLFQNSWGKDWANKGCAVLPYNIHVDEAWGIVDEIYRKDLPGTVDDDIKISIDTTDKPILRFAIKVINAIINFIRFLYGE